MSLAVEPRQEHISWTARMVLRKFDAADEITLADGSVGIREGAVPVEVIERDGNLLLNEGIGLLLDLLIGAGGTAYNNANSRIGVGDSSTAASASQTGLQAATNKAWKAMDATYPSRASQTVTWRATFATSEANFAWNEWTIVNAADDTGTNLNRKVEALGTKTSAQSWQITVTVTIS